MKVKSDIILLIRDINVHKKTRAAEGNIGHHILIFGLQVSFKKNEKKIVVTKLLIELFAAGGSHA